MLSNTDFPTSVLKVHQKNVFSSVVGPGFTFLLMMTSGFTSLSIRFEAGITDSIFLTFGNTTLTSGI